MQRDVIKSTSDISPFVLEEGEVVIRAVNGALQIGLSISEGKLMLTNRRILYSASGAGNRLLRLIYPNQRAYQIRLYDIADLRQGSWWSRFFSWTQGRPTFVVTTRDGKRWSFQASDVDTWMRDVTAYVREVRDRA